MQHCQAWEGQGDSQHGSLILQHMKDVTPMPVIPREAQSVEVQALRPSL